MAMGTGPSRKRFASARGRPSIFKEHSQVQPRVLISDALSPAAFQIFKDTRRRGRFPANLGKGQGHACEIIGATSGPSRSLGHPGDAKIIERAEGGRVIGRAGIGSTRSRSGPTDRQRDIIVMNTRSQFRSRPPNHAHLMLGAGREIPQAD